MKVRDISTGYARRNSISMSWKEAEQVWRGELSFENVRNLKTGKVICLCDMDKVKKTLWKIREPDTGRRYAVARFR